MKFKALILVMMLTLLAVPAFAQQVSVNYNHDRRLPTITPTPGAVITRTRSRTPSWPRLPSRTSRAPWRQRIPEGRGGANPDLILTASGGEKEQTSYNAWGMRGIGGGMGGITPQQNVEATMVVSLYDLKAKELVWRGIAQDTLGNNGNKNQEAVNKAVQKMFKQWPKS